MPCSFIKPIWTIATGLLEVIAAIRLRTEIKGEFWLALAGLASIAFGVFLMARPGEGALSVLWLTSVYAIAFGVMLVFLEFRVRGFVKQVFSAAKA